MFEDSNNFVYSHIQVVDAARSFKRVTITVTDVLKPLIVLALCNTIILFVWQFGPDTPKWERNVVERNDFDQTLSSVGSCTHHGNSGLPYFASLIVVNGVALILACYQAFKGRALQTQLNESKYIGMAMICIFQSCFFGVPLLFISGSNRSNMLFIVSSICFVICIATLLFIFVPKIARHHQEDTRSSARSTCNGNAGPRPNRGLANTRMISGLSTRAMNIYSSRGAASSNTGSGASIPGGHPTNASSVENRFGHSNPSVARGRQGSLPTIHSERMAGNIGALRRSSAPDDKKRSSILKHVTFSDGDLKPQQNLFHSRNITSTYIEDDPGKKKELEQLLKESSRDKNDIIDLSGKAESAETFEVKDDISYMDEDSQIGREEKIEEMKSSTSTETNLLTSETNAPLLTQQGDQGLTSIRAEACNVDEDAGIGLEGKYEVMKSSTSTETSQPACETNALPL